MGQVIGPGVQNTRDVDRLSVRTTTAKLLAGGWISLSAGSRNTPARVSISIPKNVRQRISQLVHCQ